MQAHMRARVSLCGTQQFASLESLARQRSAPRWMDDDMMMGSCTNTLTHSLIGAQDRKVAALARCLSQDFNSTAPKCTIHTHTDRHRHSRVALCVARTVRFTMRRARRPFCGRLHICDTACCALHMLCSVLRCCFESVDDCGCLTPTMPPLAHPLATPKPQYVICAWPETGAMEMQSHFALAHLCTFQSKQCTTTAAAKMRRRWGRKRQIS